MTGFTWDWGEPPDPKFWQLLSTVAKQEKWSVEHGLLAAKTAGLIARALTFPDDQVEQVSVAGLLHDVGKLTLPASLLQKPKPLTKDEYDQIQRHPSTGARITVAMHLTQGVIEAVRHHHERVDGKGYPFGKVGEEIPIEGRIVAIAEIVSAMLTPRWYRPPLSPASAIERLRSLAGNVLDPELVKAACFQLPKLFGVSSLSSLTLYTKAIPLERLVRDEEALLWRTVRVFVRELLLEMEQLMGRQFCQAFVGWLNQWLSRQNIPIQFRDLNLVSLHRWWQTLGDLTLFAKTLVGVTHAVLSHLVGATFIADWLDSVRSQLPEQADKVGLRYGLWVWRNDTADAGTAVSS